MSCYLVVILAVGDLSKAFEPINRGKPQVCKMVFDVRTVVNNRTCCFYP